MRDAVRRRTPAEGNLTADDADALWTLGIDLDVVLARLEASFGPQAVPRSEPRRGRAGMSRAGKKTLQLTLREAIWLKAGNIGSEHLLLGLLPCDDTDIKPDDLRSATLRAIGRAA